ncbi:MAG: hypothetical protein CM1200mP20_10360 [Pseudomonadota bacterium]|nr:MAG: hypothetical protein CM1200mP20_10360 [Pseudomonadota bacterium]
MSVLPIMDLALRCKRSFNQEGPSPFKSNPALLTIALKMTIWVKEKSHEQFKGLQSYSIRAIANI